MLLEERNLITHSRILLYTVIGCFALLGVASGIHIFVSGLPNFVQQFRFRSSSLEELNAVFDLIGQLSLIIFATLVLIISAAYFYYSWQWRADLEKSYEQLAIIRDQTFQTTVARLIEYVGNVDPPNTLKTGVTRDKLQEKHAG
jgi:hypothetical protein